MSDLDTLGTIINHYTPVIDFLMSAKDKIRQQSIRNTTARQHPEFGIEEKLATTELPESLFFSLGHIVPILITFQTEIILKALLLKTRELGYEYDHIHQLSKLWTEIPVEMRRSIEKYVKKRYTYPDGYQTVKELLEIYCRYYLDARYLEKGRVENRKGKQTGVVPYSQMMDLNRYLIEFANTLTSHAHQKS